MMKNNFSIQSLKKQQLLTLFGVGITVFTAVIAIAISLFQQGKGPLAPTAPQSRPDASEIISDSCTVSFVVPADTDIYCLKKAYLDEFDNSPGSYHLRNTATKFRAGENLVWSVDITNDGSETVQISLTDVLSGMNLNYVEFLDSDCGENAFNSATKTLTCPVVAQTANQTITRNFRVKISDTAPLGTKITNTAQITDGQILAQCSSEIGINAEDGALECNDLCQTDKECLDPLRCIDTGDGEYRCRLPENPDNELCEPEPTPSVIPSSTPSPTPGQGGPTSTPSLAPSNTPIPTNTVAPTATNTQIPSNTPYPTATDTPEPTSTNTPVPTNTPGQGGPTSTPSLAPSNTPIPTSTLIPTATATLMPGVTPSDTPIPTATLIPSATPTPASGCNESCSSNADCSNSSHFCFNDNGNYVCRLDSNPTSAVCAPAQSATNTTIPTGTQTPTLPLAGNTNTTTVILVTAGVIVLILGALGLLFLL